MQGVTIVREVGIKRTPRLVQMEGIFDIPPSKVSREKWTVNLPLPSKWNVGAIVGPSGSGKTTIARELWPEHIAGDWSWSTDKSIVDDFPEDMSIKEITGLLCSVGFSSPPSWVRPFHVLSNGEQFRVNLARTLAENPDLAVVDEFTSVVDRTVAKIASAAVQKAIRRMNRQFVAVSCHYDILDWLEPDWVYEPHTDHFYNGRYLHQRPKIHLEIRRVHRGAWRLFRKHHYLNTRLNQSSICFVAFWNDTPVAFSSVLHFPHHICKNIKREHRTVCLPDYQGVGIGNAVSNYVGAMVKGRGFRFQSQTSHPAMIAYRNKSPLWSMIAKPNRKSDTMDTLMKRGKKGAAKRYRATFEYCGPALDRDEADAVWSGHRVEINA